MIVLIMMMMMMLILVQISLKTARIKSDFSSESERRRTSGNEVIRNRFGRRERRRLRRRREIDDALSDRRRRRHRFDGLPRKQDGSDLRRRGAIVFLDEIGQVLVGGDRDQGLEISVRQLALQRRGGSAELADLHHKLCTTEKETKRSIKQINPQIPHITSEFLEIRAKSDEPAKEIGRSMERTRLRPPT